MSYFSSLADSLVSLWIWNITAGWFQTGLSIILMITVLWLLSGDRFVRVCGIALGAHIFSLTMLYLIVVGGLVHLLHWHDVGPWEGRELTKDHALVISFLLAWTHIFFQAIYFIILQRFSSYRAIPYIVVSLFSNLSGAFLGYGLVIICMKYLF
jgi:hypothetical protein